MNFFKKNNNKNTETKVSLDDEAEIFLEEDVAEDEDIKSESELLEEERIKKREELFDVVRNESVETSSSKKDERNARNMLLQTARELEFDIIESKDKRIKFLTRLLIVMAVISCVLGLAIAMLAPLKTAIPYMIRVDKTTGYVDKVEPYSQKTNTIDQAVVRYFVAKYVENRESYDYFTVQTMFDFVEETSTSNVFSAYRNLYLSQEFSPLTKLGDKLKMDTEINAITFLQDKTAQVRITKRVLMPNGDIARQFPETSWVVTMSFDFLKPVRTEKQRLMNPLGFEVTSYSSDRESVNK